MGATKIITVTFVAASVPSGQVTSDSLASTGTVDTYGDPTSDATSSASIRITHPAVSVTKTLHAGQDTAVQAGQPVTFDIAVTNTGDTTLTTVPLTDTYDSTTLAFDSASPAVDSASAGTVHWNNLGTLAPGASTTLTVNFTAITNPAGQITTNTVTVPSATDIYGDHPADPTAAADIKVTKPAVSVTKTRLTDGAIQSGEPVVFEIDVTNSGDTTLTDIPVTDSYDADHLAFFMSTLGIPSVMSTGLVTWDVTPIELAPGATFGGFVAFVATGPLPGLTTVNNASISGAIDENGDVAPDATSHDSVDITSPSVAITKTLAAGQDHDVQVGDTVDYDVVVTNTGDTTLTTVPVADTFDGAHLTWLGASPSADTVSGNVASWSNVGPLTPGQTTTLSVSFTASAVGSAILNSADTSGTDVNGDPAPPVAASDSTLRVSTPGIAITKTPHAGQDLQIQVGEHGRLRHHRHQHGRHDADRADRHRHVGRRRVRLRRRIADAGRRRQQRRDVHGGRARPR